MGIIGAPTTYRCDACERVGQGFTREIPDGWLAIVWVPGYLRPPGFVLPPTRFVCSKACADALADLYKPPEIELS